MKSYKCHENFQYTLTNITLLHLAERFPMLVSLFSGTVETVKGFGRRSGRRGPGLATVGEPGAGVRVELAEAVP